MQKAHLLILEPFFHAADVSKPLTRETQRKKKPALRAKTKTQRPEKDFEVFVLLLMAKRLASSVMRGREIMRNLSCQQAFFFFFYLDYCLWMCACACIPLRHKWVCGASSINHYQIPCVWAQLLGQKSFFSSEKPCRRHFIAKSESGLPPKPCLGSWARPREGDQAVKSECHPWARLLLEEKERQSHLLLREEA